MSSSGRSLNSQQSFMAPTVAGTVVGTRRPQVGSGGTKQPQLGPGNPITCNKCWRTLGQKFIVLSCNCMVCEACIDKAFRVVVDKPSCPRCLRTVHMPSCFLIDLGSSGGGNPKTRSLHRLFSVKAGRSAPITYPELLLRVERDIDDVLSLFKLVCFQARFDQKRSITAAHSMRGQIKNLKAQCSVTAADLAQARADLDACAIERDHMQHSISELQDGIEKKEEQLAKFRNVHRDLHQRRTHGLQQSHSSHSGGLAAFREMQVSASGSAANRYPNAQGHPSEHPVVSRSSSGSHAYMPPPAPGGYRSTNHDGRDCTQFRANKRRRPSPHSHATSNYDDYSG